MSSYIKEMADLPQGRLQLDGLVVAAGCNAVLENMCFTLAEAGDAVLIPTPYYAAFEFDLVARAGLTVEPVQTMQYQQNVAISLVDPALYYPTTASLDAAYQRASEKGHAPKILLLSHPMNPLGICYHASTIKNASIGVAIDEST
jgi:aspartate/methionine/tyrosine aminotransferase